MRALEALETGSIDARGGFPYLNPGRIKPALVERDQAHRTADSLARTRWVLHNAWVDRSALDDLDLIFKREGGGFKRLDKVFNGQHQPVLDAFNDRLLTLLAT